MFTLLYTGLQLWTWEVSWKRWLTVIFSQESRVVFSDRAQTEAEGVTNLGHFGSSLDFGLQILRPPQILLPNCWVTQTEALTQTMTKTVRTYSRWQPWRSKWKWGRRPWREQRRGGRCWSFPFPYISPFASSQPRCVLPHHPLRQQYISLFFSFSSHRCWCLCPMSMSLPVLVSKSIFCLEFNWFMSMSLAPIS